MRETPLKKAAANTLLTCVLLQENVEFITSSFDRKQLSVAGSAVKRSIGSTTGFHNHGEGPY